MRADRASCSRRSATGARSRPSRTGARRIYWSKDREFLKFLDLPERVGQRFELALSRSSRTDADVSMLTGKGWRVRDALEFESDLARYRQYICDSRGEFTVAKDQNVRLRGGWFSSAQSRLH